MMAALLLAMVGLSAGEERVLPSETCRGMFVVPVTVGNGQGGTFELLLDTGSAWTFVDPARLGAGKALFRNARIGSHALGPLEARAYPMERLALAVGREIDGIIGFPAFEDVLLTLDYPAGEIRVSLGELPAPDGAEIFRDVGRKRPELKVDVGGRRVKILLDSGAHGSFLFKPSDRLRWSVEPRPVKTSMTFWNVIVDRGGRLEGTVRFGPLLFEEPVVLVAPRERMAGWQVLHHFALTFDQRNDRIRLRPADSGPVRMPSLSGTGVGLRPRRAGMEIVNVFPGTPAERAGLLAGDLIVAIDGAPVHQRECGDPAGDPPGRRRSITYLRQGARHEVELETAVLIP